MNEKELKVLVEEGAIKDTGVSGSPSTRKYSITVNGRQLESAKQAVRPFVRLDTAASFLFKIGINNFSVKLSSE